MAEKRATPENSKYNRKKHIPNKSGNKGQETARKKFAKYADYPTTAAADPSLKLPEALMQVDPQKISQVLPEMYSKLMQVRNLMNLFNSINGGGTSGANNQSPGGQAKTSIINVFAGALAILVKRYGYYDVLYTLFSTLANNNYKNIVEAYQPIVFESIAMIIKKAAQYGNTSIPISTIPQITYGLKIPTPLYSLYREIPDYYVQQYYTGSLDPYPGYIEFKGPNGDSIYLRRTATDPPFESAIEEVHTTAEYDMANELDEYFKNKYASIQVLNTILVKYCTQIEQQKLEKSAGKGSSNSQNMLSMLSMFAGIAGQLAQTCETSQLPPSVLDVGSVTDSLEKHRRNIGKAKMLKNYSKEAFNPLGLLNNNSLSSLMSMMKGSMSSMSGSNSQAQNTQQKIQQAQVVAKAIEKIIL